MRNNQPVTEREHALPDDAVIMSITDTQSRITYVNADFIAASGFDRSELTGELHNVVRHPDMPREAFADMWATIRGNETWTGMVKNRRKDGDHYWVRANATPIEQDGHVSGYTSVRVKPSAQEVRAAESLYRRMREGTARGFALRKGIVVRTGMLAWLSLFQVLPLRWRIRLGAVLALGVSLGGLLLAGLSGESVAAAAGLATLGAALNCLLLEAQVERPLRRILREAQVSARGEASTHLALDRIDEIGMLARAVHQSNLNLRSLVKDVVDRSRRVNDVGAGLAHASHDLSARTESQASALEETAASMEELASAVRQNADNANEATRLAGSARQVATQGGELVSQVVQTMQGINESSRRISDIIGVIDSIAFQTNILALNAAVEAARAGEQGRGFAVVAGEVRALAGRSAEAAREIKKLITDSVARAADGSQVVADAGATMTEVVESVRQVSHLVEEISAACTEQSAGVAQVGSAVVQMEQVTQQNAAMAQDVGATVSQLAAQAGDLVLAVSVFDGRNAAGRAPVAVAEALPAPRPLKALPPVTAKRW